VEMSCNTSLSDDIMWTYDTGGDPYVHYVYWNGHIADDKRQLSTKSTAKGVHTLVISNPELNDSGLYNCYDRKGHRKVGYRIVGM